jgi:serine/threonine protein kinase/Tol biopolymer transport system component
MQLTPGNRLGPYEIVSSLGAGGMGEVYRARDSRLGRDVAIKVLPAAMDRDPDRVARFEREARAIAALNHPNVCALYDIGEQDGRAFLVMELLEGETLQQRLSRGPLEYDTVVDFGIALADALDQAHRQGFIHRDLKPANIFLTTRGLPKMLDFGLARVLDRDDDQTRAAEAGITDAGATVGTVGYMSPEQLRGRPADARSDLFSLGLVLHEMVTGRRAFAGKTTAETSAAILHEGPAPMRAARPDVPEKLEEAILKTLEKDPDLRCQSAAELRADLKRVKRGSDPTAAGAAVSGSATSATSAVPSGVAVTPASSDTQVVVNLAKRHKVTVGIAALGLIALVGLSIWLAGRPAPGGDASAGVASKIEIVPLTDTGDTSLGVLSPDGKFVASVRRIDFQNSVWVRQLSTRSDVQIVPTVKGRRFVALSITPDGSFVDFVANELGVRPPALWRVPFLGGTPKRIASDVWSATGWSPDGRRFAFARARAALAEDQLIVADADGSNERVLATRRYPKRLQTDSSNSGAPARPTWSADGSRILVIGRTAGATGGHDLLVFDAESGAELNAQPLPFFLSETAWIDATHALGNGYNDRTPPTLHLFDLSDGSSTPVTQGLSLFQGVSTTPDRKTAVSTLMTVRTGIWIGDGSGENLTPVVSDSSAWIFDLAVSNTGTIAFSAGSVLSGLGVNVSTADARPPRPILTASDFRPLLSADGRTVIFDREGKDGGLYSAAIDGSGVRRLAEGHNNPGYPILTADGKTLIFLSANAEGIQSLWSAPASGGPARVLVNRFVSGGSVSVSPDSRQVLYSGARPTPASPTPSFICDLPDCASPREVKLRTGRWTPDGKGLAYLSSSEDPGNIRIQPIDGGPAYSMTRFTDGKQIDAFAWSPDGKRFAIVRSTQSADIVLIKGFAGR